MRQLRLVRAGAVPEARGRVHAQLRPRDALVHGDVRPQRARHGPRLPRLHAGGGKRPRRREGMFEKNATATYKDTVEFICDKTLQDIESLSKTKDPKEMIAKTMIAAERLGAMEELAAFAHGKTEDEVHLDVKRLTFKKRFLESLKSAERGE